MLKRVFVMLMVMIAVSPLRALMIPLTIEELSVVSNTIVSGKVSNIESYRDPATDFIYSKISVEIDEQYRGETMGNICEVHVIGGIVDGIGLACSDAPAFAVGERALLFLSKEVDSSLLRLSHGRQAKVLLDTLTEPQQKSLGLRINRVLKLMNKP